MASPIAELQISIAADIARLQTDLKTAQNGIKQFGTSVANNNRSLRQGGQAFQSYGMVAQQAGFQVADFAVQVASGQGVMRAFTQQGSQLLGMFGPWGAVIGAAVAVVGALVMNIDKFTGSASDAEKRAGSYGKAIADAADGADRLKIATDAANQVLMDGNQLAEIAQQNKVAEAKASQELAISIEQETLARLNNLRAAQQNVLNNPNARGRDILINSGGVEAVAKQIADAEARLAKLQATLADLNDPNKFKFGVTPKKDTEEATSALDELLSSQTQELTLTREVGIARAKLQAIYDGQAAAQRDYDNELRDSPLLTGEEAARLQEKAALIYNIQAAQEAQRKAEQDAQREAERSARDQQRELERLADEWVDLAGEVANAAAGWKDWQSVAQSAIKAVFGLLQKEIESLLKPGNTGGGDLFSTLFGLLGGIFGGAAGGGGSFPGVPSGFAMAGGGKVAGNSVHLVGENGPELFVPDTSGTVIANDALMGGGSSGGNIYIDARGATKDAVAELRRMFSQMNATLENRIDARVLDQRRRGGKYADAFAA